MGRNINILGFKVFLLQYFWPLQLGLVDKFCSNKNTWIYSYKLGTKTPGTPGNK